MPNEFTLILTVTTQLDRAELEALIIRTITELASINTLQNIKTEENRHHADTKTV